MVEIVDLQENSYSLKGIKKNQIANIPEIQIDGI